MREKRLKTTTSDKTTAKAVIQKQRQINNWKISNKQTYNNTMSTVEVNNRRTGIEVILGNNR